MSVLARSAFRGGVAVLANDTRPPVEAASFETGIPPNTCRRKTGLRTRRTAEGVRPTHAAAPGEGAKAARGWHIPRAASSRHGGLGVNKTAALFRPGVAWINPPGNRGRAVPREQNPVLFQRGGAPGSPNVGERVRERTPCA